MEFKDRLKELREGKRLSQRMLAKTLYRSVGTISKLEQGIAQPKGEMLIQLADYFNCTTDYLLGRSDVRDYKGK